MPPVDVRALKDEASGAVKSGSQRARSKSPAARKGTASKAASSSKFTTTGSVTGLPKKIPNKHFSWEEIEKHNRAHDCWIVIDSCVYDVTAFVARHPGGDQLPMSSGRDVTRLFETYHPTSVWSMKNKYVIGRVKEASGMPEFTQNTDFYPTVKKRVEAHFKKHNLRYRDCPEFYVKAAVILFLCGFFQYMANWVYAANLPAALFFAACLGLAEVSVGICIMHDGNHGAVSNNWRISRLFGHTLDLIGASSFNWHYQHSLAHHQAPNDHNHDPDIGFGNALARLSPQATWKPFFRYQHLYLPPLFGLHFIKWYFNDFKTLYNGMLFTTKLGYVEWKDLAVFLFGKFFLLFQMFLLPRWSESGASWGHLFAVYFMANYAAGIYSTLAFAVGHLTQHVSWPYYNASMEEFQSDFAIHQVVTSTGYGHGWLWDTLSGGLNYQVEHHLFPSICHVQYKHVAPIVEQACAEYGIDYHYYPTFRSAVYAFWMHLYNMGNRISKEDIAADARANETRKSKKVN